MKPTVKSAIESAALALLVAACSLWFLISMNESEVEHTAAKITLVAIALAASVILHLVFVGLAVQRDGRPLAGWMALSILMCPVGSIITMVLIGWLSAERERAQPSA